MLLKQNVIQVIQILCACVCAIKYMYAYLQVYNNFASTVASEINVPARVTVSNWIRTTCTTLCAIHLAFLTKNCTTVTFNQTSTNYRVHPWQVDLGEMESYQMPGIQCIVR